MLITEQQLRSYELKLGLKPKLKHHVMFRLNWFQTKRLNFGFNER